MHASRATRLTVALAEVQKTLVRAVSSLTKRPRDRVARHDNSSNGDNSDPVLAMLTAAPIDDEPVTDDDRQHIAEGWKAYREGRLDSQEEATQACLEAHEGANVTVAGRKNPD